MKTSLVVRATASANSIGAHGHPLLEDGNMSFPRGTYLTEIVGGDDEQSMKLTHRVTHAPLIERLLREGVAGYACIVSSPKSFYREAHRSDVPGHTIRWDRAKMGEPPLFTPLVYCRHPRDIQLDAERDGVHEIWDGVIIQLSEGSRLAVGHVFDLRSSFTRMLRIRLNEELESRIRVEYANESSCFVAEVGPHLHRFLKNASPGSPTRCNVMTTIVTACFAYIREHYPQEERIEEERTLVALAAHLREKHGKAWTDDGFAPEEAATALFPHRLDEESSE